MLRIFHSFESKLENYLTFPEKISEGNINFVKFSLNLNCQLFIKLLLLFLEVWVQQERNCSFTSNSVPFHIQERKIIFN